MEKGTKTLDREELKALLDIFGGTTPERIDWLVFHGIEFDFNDGELWMRIPIDIEDAIDPTITRF